MRDNINKVAERGERLDSLESKTGTRKSFWMTWLTVRQSRCIGTRIPTWCKSCSKTNVVESNHPLPETSNN
jgi:hypothetical protein